MIDKVRTPPSAASWCPLVELRQYALHPGQREYLIQLFDTEFIESQESVGLTVMGQFRDLDNPNTFVWLRGFAGMDTRAQALSSFYDGPVWRTYRDQANATMVDSDNVLLLRPARPGSGFAEVARPGEAAIDRDRRNGLMTATIYYLAQPVDIAFLDFFEGQLAPPLRDAGAVIDGYYTTEPTPNNFPRLPVRENEPVLVWFASFPNTRAHLRFLASFTQRLPTTVRQRLAGFLRTEPESHRLAPTRRSRLPGDAAGSA